MGVGQTYIALVAPKIILVLDTSVFRKRMQSDLIEKWSMALYHIAIVRYIICAREKPLSVTCMDDIIEEGLSQATSNLHLISESCQHQVTTAMMNNGVAR